MDIELKSFLKQDFTLEPFLKQNGAGDQIYTAGTPIKGYLTGKTVYRVGPTGEQIVSQQRVFVDETIVVKAKDRITVPGGAKHLVQDTQRYYSESGALDYTEVFL